MRGSVFPKSFLVAVPCALLSAGIKVLIQEGFLPYFEDRNSVMIETQAWTAFSALVGFLVVFRTSQSYTRFWGGCTATHQMRAEWFDACSAVMSFCHVSKANAATILTFQGKLIRLFSMLHAAALAELEEINHDVDSLYDINAFSFKLIDPNGLDTESLNFIKQSDSKVELLFSWIQMLLVENIDTGVLCIAPPILSRSFQELANGMVAFNDAVKITYIPFPFPYAQTCDTLLLLHWLTSPLIVAQWVTHPAWAAVFVFLQVFILWSLNFIAAEIENPFGTDDNDLDGHGMQEEMNRHLLLLLHKGARRLPELTGTALDLSTEEGASSSTEDSFLDIWERVGDREPVPEPLRKHMLALGPVVGRTRTSFGSHPTPRRSHLSAGLWRRSSSSINWDPRCARLVRSNTDPSGMVARHSTSASSDPTAPTSAVPEPVPEGETHVVWSGDWRSNSPRPPRLRPERNQHADGTPLPTSLTSLGSEWASKLDCDGEVHTRV